MITEEELIRVGAITKTHGLAGEVNVLMDMDIDPVDLERVAIEVDGIFVPFYVESARTKGTMVLLLRFDGVDNAESANELCGLPLFVFRKDNIIDTELDEGESYISDLIDFVIEDESGATIGRIVDIDDSTENTLFIVETSGGNELMIPVADDFIVSVDDSEKTLVLSLPPGLLDLN